MCPKPERRDLTTTTSNVTDQTYVTQTGHLKINTEYKPVVNLPFSHENSFSNNTMVMLSPSQKPLANSTVLNSTSEHYFLSIWIILFISCYVFSRLNKPCL